MKLKNIIIDNFRNYTTYFRKKEIDYFEGQEQFQIENDEMNKRRQEQLEKEFIEYKNLGIILFDIIPYKKREFLIESLKKLFNYDNLTPIQRCSFHLDFEKVLPEVEIDSTRHGYSIINVGTIQNLNLENGFIFTPETELPFMFHNLRIKITQFGDVYLLTIIGELKEEFKTKGIKESFIHLDDLVPNIKKSDDGRVLWRVEKSRIKCDPNMESYLKKLTEFLKEFGFGFYLNKDSNQICPNIKVTYLEEIPYDKFEDWSFNNFGFLNFLGFSFYNYSKIENNMWGIQSKRITNKLSISAGLVILASKDEDIIDNYENMESGILIEISNFISYNEFIDILYQLYWANYNLEKITKDCKKSLDNYVDRLNEMEPQKVKIKMESLFKLNNEMTKKYLRFEIYRINEDDKYNFFTKNLKYRKSIEDLVKPLKTKNSELEFNIYEYIFLSGRELLDKEKIKIESLTKEFATVFNYLNNITNLTSSQINLKYQGKVKNYTSAVLILTFIMIVLTCIMIY